MRITTMLFALAAIPAALSAQQAAESGHAQASARAGSVAAPESRVVNWFSVEGQARAEAMLESARERNLPPQPVLDMMAEGQAKGATEGQVLDAGANVLAQLQESHDALVQGGHTAPTEDEVSRGQHALARGATSAQLEAMVEHAPADRRLTVAFETLTALAERGVPVDKALEQVGSRLSAGASDGEIAALASGNAAAGLERAAAAPAANASATGSAAASAAGAGQSTAGAVNGGVHVGKP